MCTQISRQSIRHPNKQAENETGIILDRHPDRYFDSNQDGQFSTHFRHIDIGSYIKGNIIIDSHTDEQADWYTDREAIRDIDGQADNHIDRETERHIEGQADIQRDRHTDREADKYIDEQADKHIHRQANIQRDR